MATKQTPQATTATPRQRMLKAAAELLVGGGRAAASTRAVSALAGVQAPAIYRQFGDLDGLLREAARDVMRDYVRTKALRTPLADPLEDLRRGFDQHVAFGLAHPAAFAILTTDIDTDDDDTHRDGQAILQGLVERIARAGLLRVSVAHAVALIHAAGAGATLALIGTPAAHRDLRVATDLRDATIAAITIPTTSSTSTSTTTTASTIAARAIALQAVLDDDAAGAASLSSSEQQLLREWLQRLAAPSC